MLLQEGFYASECISEGLQAPCRDQQVRLNRAYTFASTAVSVVSLPTGAFVDHYGPIAGAVVAGTLHVLGLSGIALSSRCTSSSWQWTSWSDVMDEGVSWGEMGCWAAQEIDLFGVSLITVAVAGALTMFCAFSVPFLYPDKATLLMTLTSVLFDGACIIFPIFHMIYQLYCRTVAHRPPARSPDPLSPTFSPGLSPPGETP